MRYFNLFIFIAISALSLYSCGEDELNNNSLNTLPPEENSTKTSDDQTTDSIEPLSESLIPFYKEGRKWITESQYESGECRKIERTAIRKTNIDGCEAWEVEGKFDDNTWTMYYWEDNGKHYKRNPQDYIDHHNESWGLEFDIYATKADSIKDSYYLYPVSRGTVVTMGKTRRALKVHIPYDMAMYNTTKPYGYILRSKYEYDYIIEGIGFVYGHELCRRLVLPTGPFGPKYIRLLECWDGDEKIFDHNDFSEEKFIEGSWE